MKESIHYLVMANYLQFQKSLISNINNPELTSGQPKILEYLLFHDYLYQPFKNLSITLISLFSCNKPMPKPRARYDRPRSAKAHQHAHHTPENAPKPRPDS